MATEAAWVRWTRIFVDRKLAEFADGIGKAIAERDRVLRAEFRAELEAREHKADADTDADAVVLDMRHLGRKRDAA